MIPIFIITHDRIEVLRRTLASIERIDTPYQVVIHDYASTFPEMLKYLEELERDGVFVVRCSDTYHSPALNHTIQNWLSKNPSTYYVVTDPDIELDCPGDVLDIYAHILDHTNADAVGPQLIIDDLPDHFPLKKRVTRDHGHRFWSTEPKEVTIGLRTIKYIDQYPNGHPLGIDTTFALYKGDYKFRRAKPSVRVYPPYAARHLDWYIDINNLTPDQEYYLRWSQGRYGAIFIRELMIPFL